MAHTLSTRFNPRTQSLIATTITLLWYRTLFGRGSSTPVADWWNTQSRCSRVCKANANLRQKMVGAMRKSNPSL
jgi:hypothetical protein